MAVLGVRGAYQLLFGREGGEERDVNEMSTPRCMNDGVRSLTLRWISEAAFDPRTA